MPKENDGVLESLDFIDMQLNDSRRARNLDAPLSHLDGDDLYDVVRQLLATWPLHPCTLIGKALLLAPPAWHMWTRHPEDLTVQVYLEWSWDYFRALAAIHPPLSVHKITAHVHCHSFLRARYPATADSVFLEFILEIDCWAPKLHLVHKSPIAYLVPSILYVLFSCAHLSK